MCRNSPYITVSSRSKANRTITIQPDCETWGCPYGCQDILKNKWIGHAETILREYEAQGWVFGYARVAISAFASLTRQCRRCGIKVFRVHISKCEYGVVFGALPGKWRHLSCRLTTVTANGAGCMFRSWAMTPYLTAGSNPISSSRAWSLPRKSYDDYELVNVGARPETVRLLAAITKAQCQDRMINSLSATICTGASDVMDAFCDRLRAIGPYFSSKSHRKSNGENTDTESHREYEDVPYYRSIYGPSNVELAT